MAKSVSASAGYLGRVTGSVVNSDFTLIVAFMWPDSPAANQYRGILDIRGRLGTPTLSAFQIYQVGDSEPGPGVTVFFKRPDNTTNIVRTLGTNAELVGKWIHVAMVFTNLGNEGLVSLYAVTEGFDRFNPQYLTDPDIGLIRPAVDSGNLYVFWDGEDDVSETGHLGHYILVPRALSEDECLDQFLQRDPIGSIVGDDYSYLSFWLASAAGKDWGPTASDFTNFSISPSNTDLQPSEWKGLASQYWLQESSVGILPVTSGDDVYPPVPLALTFTGAGSWGENAAGRGILTGGDTGNFARARVSGTKYDQFDQSQQLSFTLALDFSPSDDFGFGLEVVGARFVWYLSLPGDGTLRSLIDSDEAVASLSGVSGGYHVLTVVLDLGAASSTDRYKVYVDGVLMTTTTGHSPSLVVDFQGDDVDLTVGFLFPSGTYSLFVYSYAVDASRAAADASLLLTSNDSSAIRVGGHGFSYGTATAAFTSSTLNISVSKSSVFVLVNHYRVENVPAPPSISGFVNGVPDGSTYQLIASSSLSDTHAVSNLYYCQGVHGGEDYNVVASFSDVQNVVSVFIVEVLNGRLYELVDRLPSGRNASSQPFTSNPTGLTRQAREMALAFTGTGSASGTEVFSWLRGFVPVDVFGDPSNFTGSTAYARLPYAGSYEASFFSSGAGTAEVSIFVVTLRELGHYVAAVQSVDGPADPDSGPYQQAYGSDVRSGDHLVVTVFWDTDVTAGVTDSLGNLYSDCGLGRTPRPSDGYAQSFVARSSASGACIVTVSFSGSTSGVRIALAEYSGVDRHDPVGVSASGTATSGDLLGPGVVTPAVGSGALLLWAVSDSAGTSSTGFPDALVKRAGDLTYFGDFLFGVDPGSVDPSVFVNGAMSKGVAQSFVLLPATDGFSVRSAPGPNNFLRIVDPGVSPSGDWSTGGWFWAGENSDIFTLYDPGPGRFVGAYLDAGTVRIYLSSSGVGSDEVVVGNEGEWIFLCLTHVSGSSDYTAYWRKQGESSLHSHVLTVGSIINMTPHFTVLGSDVGGDVRGRSFFFFGDSFAVSPSYILAQSENLDFPSDVPLIFLFLDSVSDMTKNYGNATGPKFFDSYGSFLDDQDVPDVEIPPPVPPAPPAGIPFPFILPGAVLQSTPF